MRMYYVSHPFTGDEEWNKKDAREQVARLKKENPQYLFINPLDAFTYAEDLPYTEIIKQCLELMRNCDGLVLTGNWENSRGCLLELQEAEQHGLEIIDLTTSPMPKHPQLSPAAEKVVTAVRKMISEFYKNEHEREQENEGYDKGSGK